jgi:hypothetical protein
MVAEINPQLSVLWLEEKLNELFARAILVAMNVNDSEDYSPHDAETIVRTYAEILNFFLFEGMTTEEIEQNIWLSSESAEILGDAV